MFNSISWSSYLQFIFFILLPYYAAILAVYYRKDIFLQFAGWQQSSTRSGPASPIDKTVQTNKENNAINDALFSSVHDLLEELKTVFKSANDKNYPKEELLMALQVKLKAYPQLKGTAFQVAINNHIVQQAVECKMPLEENEIKHCW